MVGFFFLVSSRVMYLFIAIAVIAVVLLMLRKRRDVPVSVCEQIIGRTRERV
jgi:hypothetical protein